MGEAQFGHALSHRLVHLVGGTFAIDEVPVELKVEEVMEATTDIPRPMEEVMEESTWSQQYLKELVTFFLWYHMQDLVEKPDDFGCSRAVVQINKLVNAIHEEGPIEVRWDQYALQIELQEPLAGHLERSHDCQRFKDVGLAEGDLDYDIEQLSICQERLECLN